MTYDLRNDDADIDQQVINVSSGRVEQLHQRFVKVWQRTPTQQEMDSLINRYVLDEIYAREARSMGLDENDSVIRKRLRQKLEFMMQDISTAKPPEQDVLQAFFQQHQDNYRLEDSYSFQQVFISDDQEPDQVNRWLEQQQQRITKGLEPEGHSSLLPANLVNHGAGHIARQFGDNFAQALSSSPIEQWYGPIESGYGKHFVYIEDVQPGTLPALADIKDKVIADWRYQKDQDFQDKFEQELLKRYQINVDMSMLLAGE
ncbi:peptidyl-prolyl cis-trans isomerase [Thalassotalea mangrovi]|uniref:peptidylprolyl isomerase n=1 Tax=Thalassotalea mangrovi TaxID=2572245 RepID=UPI00145E157B|nr:peptidylprolyl isomerase [Thalassotalea mangrovi]